MINVTGCQRVSECEVFFCGRIQSSHFDGSDVRTLGSAGHRISHPFGLALYHGNVKTRHYNGTFRDVRCYFCLVTTATYCYSVDQ